MRDLLTMNAIVPPEPRSRFHAPVSHQDQGVPENSGTRFHPHLPGKFRDVSNEGDVTSRSENRQRGSKTGGEQATATRGQRGCVPGNRGYGAKQVSADGHSTGRAAMVDCTDAAGGIDTLSLDDLLLEDHPEAR